MSKEGVNPCSGCESTFIDSDGILTCSMNKPILCKACGSEPAITRKDGTVHWHGLGRKCFGDRLRAGKKEKREKKKAEKEKQIMEGTDISVEEYDEHTLILNFLEYEELLETLRRRAEVNFRTPEQHALFLINLGLKDRS